MISKSRSMQGMDIVSSSNAVAGYVYQKQSDIVYYFQLKRMNDSLLVENARIRNRIADSSNIDTFTSVVATIPVTIKDTTTKPKDTATTTTNTAAIPAIKFTPTNKTKVLRYAAYSYLPARVVKNSVADDRVNYITINRGTADGVKPKMAVVTTNGIVGQVQNVSEHFATVASVLSNRKVSFKLADGTSDMFVMWNPGNPDYLVAEKVPLLTNVKKGDSLFTTSYSMYYPENILIGTVAKIDTIKATNAKNLKVKLSTNFRKLQYVYIVENKMAGEMENLDSKNKEINKP